MAPRKSARLSLRVTKAGHGNKGSKSVDKSAAPPTTPKKPALSQAWSSTTPAASSASIPTTATTVATPPSSSTNDPGAQEGSDTADLALEEQYDLWRASNGPNAILNNPMPLFLSLDGLSVQRDDDRMGYVILPYSELMSEVQKRDIDNRNRQDRGLVPRTPAMPDLEVLDVKDRSPDRLVSVSLSWMISYPGPYPGPEDSGLFAEWAQLVAYYQDLEIELQSVQSQSQSSYQYNVQDPGTDQQGRPNLRQPKVQVSFTNPVKLGGKSQTRSVHSQFVLTPPTKPPTYLGLQPHIVQGPTWTVASLICRPIGISAVKVSASPQAARVSKINNFIGTLYAFTRPSDPGFIKIGYTADSLYNRMTTIKSHCRFEPVLEVIFENVPYPTRVEGLIHLELNARGIRRVEEVCRHGSEVARGSTRRLCKGNHSEWFEMELHGDDGAEAVMERWVRWMKMAQPYDEQGKLTDTWTEALAPLISGQAIDGAAELKGWDVCELMHDVQPGKDIGPLVAVGEKRKMARNERRFQENAIELVKSKRALFQDDGADKGWLAYQPFCKEVYGYAHDTSDKEESGDEGPDGQFDVCWGIW